MSFGVGRMQQACTALLPGVACQAGNTSNSLVLPPCLQADRQKVMNMITIDAHSRDIVANMVKDGTPDANSFLWMCQLRSYWDSSISDCRIKICDATFGYGYEYLGNGARLVITPLTDRIYITATQACWLCMGTAPAGPAGGQVAECPVEMVATHSYIRTPHGNTHAARTIPVQFCQCI